MHRKLLAVPAEQPDESGSISNVPAQLTPLIGRTREVEVACTLLQRADMRLLTLTGPGGVGKTHLALQVATDLLGDFAEGVYFVSLAPISDPVLVVPTIACTLGFGTIEDRSLAEQLKAYLHDKRLLLLLDNFEQVVAAAPLLVELLTGCPKLKLLVTSRAPLHIRGEHEFPVPPLALPDPKRLPDSAALSQYGATALFVQRALAVIPDFQITDTNAPVIVEICARLDGLPLAIELAAARVKLLSPQALLARLEHRLDTLTSGAQDLPVRQQTLRSTLKWSYDLLNEREQRLFRRLSVFVDGCTLEAVEAVSAALGDAALGVMDGVASLLDKSQLQRIEQVGDEPRLLMLETLREYGLELLVTHGEIETTRAAHAAYYLRLSEMAEPNLTGTEQERWLHRFEWEQENLRTVLCWLIKRAEMGEVEHAERALRLGGALLRFWTVHDYGSEDIASCLEGLAGVIAAQGEPVRAVLLWGAVESLREAMGMPIPPGERVRYDRAVTLVRAQLSEETFAAAWAEGRTMTPEQAFVAQGRATIPLLPNTISSGSLLTPSTYPAGLSAREVEVLRLVADGFTNSQIAEQLVISPLTVNAHVRSIYNKLEVSSRSAATRFAIQHHLV